MSIPDNAVLRKAKNVRAGDRLCFSYSYLDYVVERVEICGKPEYPQVVFSGEGGLINSTYRADELVYVVLP